MMNVPKDGYITFVQYIPDKLFLDLFLFCDYYITLNLYI